MGILKNWAAHSQFGSADLANELDRSASIQARLFDEPEITDKLRKLINYQYSRIDARIAINKKQ